MEVSVGLFGKLYTDTSSCKVVIVVPAVSRESNDSHISCHRSDFCEG